MKKNKFFAKNPYILVKKKQEGWEVSNKLDGNKILCGEKIIDILHFLTIPKTYDDIKEKYNSESSLYDIITTLVNKNIIYDTNQVKKLVTSTFPCIPYLFNLKYLALYELSKYDYNKICFLGIPFGLGNRKNTKTYLFPNKYRVYIDNLSIDLSHSSSLNYEMIGNNNQFKRIENYIENHLLFDLGNVFFDSNENIDFCYEKIYSVSKKLFNNQNKTIPFFIGGDHSISYPILKAAHDKYGNDLIVFHFDAHTDSYFNKYDYLKHDKKIHHHGNFVSYCIDYGIKHFYQFGVRGITNLNSYSNESQTIYSSNILKELISQKDLFKNISRKKKVYVSFDFDVLDPSIFNSTSTPVINGLTMTECIYLFKTLLEQQQVVGVDLVEVNPKIGNNELSFQIVTEIILNLINYVNV